MNGPVIRCKVSFRARRQEAVTLTVEPEAATVRPASPTAIARRLALAHLVERLIDERKIADYAHAARLLGITRARMSQIMDLALVPVDAQERVLAGEYAGGERGLRRCRQP